MAYEAFGTAFEDSARLTRPSRKKSGSGKRWLRPTMGFRTIAREATTLF